MKTHKRLRELLSNIVMKDWDWLSDTDIATLRRFQTDDNALDARDGGRYAWPRLR